MVETVSKYQKQYLEKLTKIDDYYEIKNIFTTYRFTHIIIDMFVRINIPKDS